MDEDPGTQTQAPRFRLAIPSQRALQVVLGFFWILDAALQFQSYMFGRSFDTFILNIAAGRPFVVGDLITHIGNFLGPDIAVWNTFFALICSSASASSGGQRCDRRWRSLSPGHWVCGSSARGWA